MWKLTRDIGQHKNGETVELEANVKFSYKVKFSDGTSEWVGSDDIDYIPE